LFSDHSALTETGKLCFYILFYYYYFFFTGGIKEEASQLAEIWLFNKNFANDTGDIEVKQT